ncbi:hypothetical protein PENSUB_9537 [Penicillium subrubescens]|uniref:Heat shock 70 kDa protein 12B n=1 Tax=Penicillium subrubescens TaxID=1316194 RepID=A0A1Q5TD10_9EURO|nr:hypothetical protein PENSUB_9537 [Penicillium subrubescens]
MEQTQHREVPREIWLAIDFGTNTTEVAVSVDPTNPAGTADYLLKFPSSASTQVENYTTELDTTIVFTKDAKKFSFGSDGASYANREMFRHWKLGTMGVKPYDENLIESCRGVQQCLGLEHGHFTPASLFRILFEHILKTAKDHLRNEYGESFGPIKAWLTYPVSCGESIRILLLQEAIAAGIVVMGSVSESLSAACFLEKKHNLSKHNPPLPDGARLILDFGGATLVECRCPTTTVDYRLIIRRMPRLYTRTTMASWFRLVRPTVCFAFRDLGATC